MPEARIHLPTQVLPPRIQQAVLQWVGNLNPSELGATIEQDGSLVELVRRSCPFVPVGFVGSVLTAEERAALRRLRRADFDRLLDVFLAETPAVGELLWQHRDWYFREIAKLRDAVLGS